MQVENAGVSGVIPVVTNTGAAPVATPSSTDPVVPTPDPLATGQYSADFVNKVLKEKKNTAEHSRQVEAELQALKEKDMLANNQKDELIQSLKADKEALEVKYQERNKLIENEKKKGALQTELMKLGCKQEYMGQAMKLIDMNNVDYDSDTGVVTGHDLAAKVLSQDISALFGHTGVGVNQSAPVGQPNALTTEQFLKLPLDERRKQQAAFMQSQGIPFRR